MQSLEFEAGYSRQGNLYAGDTQNTNSNDLVKENYGKETNLGVAGVEVALAAVAGLKLQRLHRSEFPAHQTIDVFVFHPFAPGRQSIGIDPGTLGLMALVDTPI